ncbi:MAG TPA: cystathionine gamma-synthase [Gammaproteobacteria bacterium]
MPKDHCRPIPAAPLQRDFATAAARAGIETDSQFGAVMPPLHLSVNFSFAGYGQKRRYDYTRSGNPTRDLLAGALAELESGAGCVVTASGMASVSLLLQLLDAGDRLVVPHDCYGGSYRLFTAWARKRYFELEVVDMTDLPALDAALAAKPRLVWLETPSNPLLRITDIAEVARRCHAAGSLVVVDNTFLSAAWQQPLGLGADFVLYSTTKYINGHSDVVGGAVISADAALHEQLGWWANCLGLTGAPFDSYLTLRGLRTLPARLRLHEENAAAAVELLARQPGVRRVHYPGLASHPGHMLAARQQRSFGALVSFELEGGELAVRRFVSGLRCITLAESLGGVETLVAHPATMTHAAMDPEARRRAGIGDSLLRLSVGIEAAADLLRDLQAACERADVSKARERQA